MFRREEGEEERGRDEEMGEEKNGGIRGKMGFVAARESHRSITSLDWKHGRWTWQRIYTHTHIAAQTYTHWAAHIFIMSN